VVILREGQKLKCENEVLGEIFGPKKDEVRHLLYDDELRDFCRLPVIVWIMKCRSLRWVGLVSRMWDKMNA
jgi:hypothetical protein